MDTPQIRKNQITLTFNITPVACARPRFGKFGTYTPKKTSDYKAAITKLLKHELDQNPKIKNKIPELYERPVCLVATFYMPIPQRLIKKNSEPWRTALPTSKPDTDNLLKATKDILSGVIFKDDSQVTHEFVRKLYSDQPRVELIIYEADVFLKTNMFAVGMWFNRAEVAITRVGMCFRYNISKK